MKVLLVNGSPHRGNTTYRALKEVADALNKEGIETEIYHLKPTLQGCMACDYCDEHHKCVVDDDVNYISSRLDEFDGFVFGTPTYYANPSGTLRNFLDRLYYSNPSSVWHLKAGAAVSVSRRSGNTSVFDSLNKYFTISGMVVIGSNYWNEVYGNDPEEAEKDLEGLRIMRNLGKNMAYYLKLRELGKKEGLKEPEIERGPATNFIR